MNDSTQITGRLLSARFVLSTFARGYPPRYHHYHRAPTTTTVVLLYCCTSYLATTGPSKHSPHFVEGRGEGNDVAPDTRRAVYYRRRGGHPREVQSDAADLTQQ